MEKSISETQQVGIYYSLEDGKLHAGPNHFSLELIWRRYGIETKKEAVAFTRQYGYTPDECYPSVPNGFVPMKHRPICPHCTNPLSPAGGLLYGPTTHWKCFDCNYEVDDVPSTTAN